MERSEIKPLSRGDVIKAIERKNPPRIPLVIAKWWGEGLENQYGDKLKTLDHYPEDVVWLWIDNPVNPDKMNLSWEWKSGGARDSNNVIDDWAKIDEFIEKLPNPHNDPQLLRLAETVDKARKEDRYLLFGWWHFFFEKPWMLRGMEKLMCDYITDQDSVHKLYKAMCETYCGYIQEAAKMYNPDGFWSSDDLGHQTGPMIGPNTFREMIFPYYVQVGKVLKDCGMHFWLHSCGDNTLLMPHLIESGLTVFHPVQKHTMDEVKMVAEFGDKITFLAGFDVQHVLQEETPEGVRKEVRFLIDTFDQPNAGMCIAAGNGIVSGTPLENIEAFLDEAVIYGKQHRKQITSGG